MCSLERRADYEDNHVCHLKPPVDFEGGVLSEKSQVICKNSNTVQDRDNDKDEKSCQETIVRFVFFLHFTVFFKHLRFLSNRY